MLLSRALRPLQLRQPFSKIILLSPEIIDLLEVAKPIVALFRPGSATIDFVLNERKFRLQTLNLLVDIHGPCFASRLIFDLLHANTSIYSQFQTALLVVWG